MKQIDLEAILEKHINWCEDGGRLDDQFTIEEVKDAMKEACEKILDIAAEEVKIKYDHYDDMAAYIDKNSILKIKERL